MVERSAQMLRARGSKSSVSRYVRSCRRCWNLEGPDATLDTRLSYRDGCSIMSTCSTCRPLQLNRSPDYPMTHNARYPPRLCARSCTYTHTCTRTPCTRERTQAIGERAHPLARLSYPIVLVLLHPCAVTALPSSVRAAFRPPPPPPPSPLPPPSPSPPSSSSPANGCRYAGSRTIVAL